jgi:N-acetylglucosamine-6-phosphate deacetylase
MSTSSQTALVNGRILIDGGLVDDRSVLLDGDRIVAVVESNDPRCASAQKHDLAGKLLLPGFIDLQVNGGGGVLFNDAPSVESIRAIGAAHRKFGTAGFLPTLISADLDVVAKAIEAVRAALAAKVPGVLGIHIEGPFLNVERKGIHDPEKFRELDGAAVKLLTSLQGGRTLVTLAPEMTTPAMIRKLVDAGVVVSAGHTNATYEQIQVALQEGLTGFTHLFNAMSPLTGRAPGVVGAALDDPDSWCGIIVDGEHTDPVVLRISMRCKRHDRFILVTDAMPGVGTNNKSFVIGGRKINVSGNLCLDEDGRLAGSNIDMASCVRNAMSMLGLSLPDAVRMASLYPAQFMGLAHELGRIAPGYRANFVVADDQIHVSETWIDGRAAAQGGA